MFVILMLFLVGFVVAQNNNSNNNENDSDKFPKNNTRHYCQGNTSGVCPDNVIPVCGWFNQEKIQCVIYPCAKTFGNECTACKDEKVSYWTNGECPDGRLNPTANEPECPQNCTCTGNVTKCPVEGGREMTISAGKSGNIIVQMKGVNMTTNVTLYKSDDGRFYGNFKDNETKEIKVLPDEAKERIEELEPNLGEEKIALDENALYQINAKKKARLFWIFSVNEKVNGQISSETGEVEIKTPWWGFLARDVKEE